MLLAVDVGNTNTVLGLFDGERLTDSWRVKTDARATADELALLFRGLLERHPVPDGVAVCSTVPAVLHEMRSVLTRYYAKVPAVIVEPGVKTGVPLLYDNPREVGADRIVNSLAAFTIYGGPAIVVDFGTSTNFDVVSAKGEFLGGALAPGIEISVDALASRGARLFKVELARPRSVIAKTTTEALQSGTLYGFAGQVDGLVRRIEAELGEKATVVATGGLAPLVLGESETLQHYEPELTLIGLRIVFHKNIEPRTSGPGPVLHHIAGT
jgi:type III pantothenate kinase